MNVKGMIVSMSRAWDKDKKNPSLDRIRTYDLPNTGRALYPLSYGENRGEQGHILGSYLTRVLHTARISNVDCVMYKIKKSSVNECEI